MDKPYLPITLSICFNKMSVSVSLINLIKSINFSFESLKITLEEEEFIPTFPPPENKSKNTSFSSNKGCNCSNNLNFPPV